MGPAALAVGKGGLIVTVKAEDGALTEGTMEEGPLAEGREEEVCLPLAEEAVAAPEGEHEEEPGGFADDDEDKPSFDCSQDPANASAASLISHTLGNPSPFFPQPATSTSRIWRSKYVSPLRCRPIGSQWYARV